METVTFTGTNVLEVINWDERILVGAGSQGDPPWLWIQDDASLTGEGARVDVGDTVERDTNGKLAVQA